MGPLITLFVMNAVFLGAAGLVYVFVTRRRVRVYVLIEHLAELARRSLPLSTGLRQMAADLGGRFGSRLGRLARQLEDGRPLGEALIAEPGAFPPAVGGLVELGGRGGNLAGFLDELRKTYRRMTETTSRTVYFFLYPVFLTIFISLALAALQAGVVPRLTEILRQMDTRSSYEAAWTWLSFANQCVFVFSLVLALFILSGGGSTLFGVAWPRPLRSLLGRAALAVPLLAGLVRDRACAQLALASSLLLRAGGSLPEALAAAALAEGNLVLARRFSRVAARVSEGERFSAAARLEDAFPDDFLWFIESGEASGALAEHLREASVHFDTRSRFAAQVASRAVVPFFVLLNGALVLCACLLTFFPMRDILRSLTPW